MIFLFFFILLNYLIPLNYSNCEYEIQFNQSFRYDIVGQ